ncbi:MAG TPA: YjgN family protein [Usitatibacteraceae bacterium]|nr:YjgN family protein [Usitatibacteraceae bacterium]
MEPIQYDSAATPPPLPFAATAEPPAVPAEPVREHHPFSFTGSGAEYFGIWIVNLFLTVLTLGIYSAWAKVRKKRYFYGHTWVAGANFEYHADPIAILKGRLIAFVAFAAYSAASYASPRLGQALFAALVLVAPWFIARSFAFNARYSSYRNLRFRNVTATRDVLLAVWPFLLGAVAALYLTPEFEPGQTKLGTAQWLGLFAPSLILLLAYPYVFGALKRVHINRSSYGGAAFAIDAGIGAFYKLYLKAYLIGIVALVCFGMVGMMALFVPVLGAIIFLLAYVIAGAAAIGYLRSRVGNLVFNRTSLAGGVGFHSVLSAVDLAKLYGVNILAISVSFGLLIPWAAVRVARYRASCLMLVAHGSLEQYLEQRGQDVAATGEEIGEMFDVDLSL